MWPPAESYCSKYKHVIFVDTKTQCERIAKLTVPEGHKLINVDEFYEDKGKYNVIFLICVLHIIPEIDTRAKLLKLVYNKLTPGGFLVVDVPQGEPYYRKRMKAENKYMDGYILGNGLSKTFYKNYYSGELDSFITGDGLFTVFKKKYFEKHLVRIYQRSCE